MATRQIPIISDATRRSRQAVPNGRAKKRVAQPTERKPTSRNAPPAPTRKPTKKPTKRATDLAVVPKDEPASTEVVPHGKKPKIGKTDLENMRSIIGDKVEHIQQLLGDGNFESATNSMHTVLLQTLVDIIPYAENAIRESKGQKGVYQINSLASMILETLNSARAQSDRGQLASVIVERAVQPAFKLLAEALVREFMALSADLSTANKAEHDGILRDTRGRLAEAVQKSYHNISDSIIKQMAG